MLIENYFLEYLDYLEAEKNASIATLKSYTADFKIFLEFFRSNRISLNIKTIKITDIRKYIIFLKKEQNYKNETIRRKINSLKSFFSFLISQEYLLRNPMLKITTPRREKRFPKYFTADQVQLILATAKNSTDDFALKNYILIKLFAVTGIRRQEAVDLNFDDIDFGEYTMKVIGKGNKERIIPLPEEFGEELWAYFQSRLPLKSHALFISKTGHRMHATATHRVFVKILTKIGLDRQGLALHSLRHSYATMLVQNGVDLISVKELLGHQDMNTTAIYSHVTPGHLREQIKKLPY